MVCLKGTGDADILLLEISSDMSTMRSNQDEEIDWKEKYTHLMKILI